jgi:hypothetical protein
MKEIQFYIGLHCALLPVGFVFEFHWSSPHQVNHIRKVQGKDKHDQGTKALRYYGLKRP